MKSLQRLFIAVLCLPLFGGCASTLSTWHDQSYIPVLETSDPEVQLYKGEIDTITEGPDMKAQADWLYSQGYLLLGYSKFTHTVVPGFSNSYAEMYGELIGAERVMQETPKKISNDVYAYTVTYWARGRNFPFGAYYNDMPEDTRIFYPDSLREFLDGGMPVMIEEVVVDSPAAQAGLNKGELIAGINGQPLKGADDMDKRLISSAGQESTMQIWGPNGLRTVTVQIGQIANKDSVAYPGAEVHYYTAPWELHDYQDFSYISHAFQQAVNDSIAAYNAQQEAERQRAYEAYQNARISALENSQNSNNYNPREARARGEASPNPGRMGLPVGGNMNFSYGGSGYTLGNAMSDASTSWYFHHKSMWVPSGSMGGNVPF